jgi:hypothetical protein
VKRKLRLKGSGSFRRRPSPSAETLNDALVSLGGCLWTYAGAQQIGTPVSCRRYPPNAPFALGRDRLFAFEQY